MYDRKMNIIFVNKGSQLYILLTLYRRQYKKNFFFQKISYFNFYNTRFVTKVLLIAFRLSFQFKRVGTPTNTHEQCFSITAKTFAIRNTVNKILRHPLQY